MNWDQRNRINQLMKDKGINGEAASFGSSLVACSTKELTKILCSKKMKYLKKMNPSWPLIGEIHLVASEVLKENS